MDWKEIKNRLEQYNNTPLVVRESNTTSTKYKFGPKKYTKFWDLCHKDLYSSYTDLIEQSFGESMSGSFVAQCRNWFRARAWGELPERRSWLEDNFDMLLQKHRDGMSFYQISKEYNLNQGVFCNFMKERGVKSQTYFKVTKSIVNEWSQMRKQRASYEKIAEQYGVDKSTVQKYMKGKVVKKSKTEIHKESVLELYKSGITNYSEIARRLDLNHSLVSRIIKKSLAESK